MNMLKLIYNELIKNTKKMSFIIFSCLIIISIVLSYFLLKMGNNEIINKSYMDHYYTNSKIEYEKNAEDSQGLQKEYYNKLVKLFTYTIDNKIYFAFNSQNNYKEILANEIKMVLENSLGINDKNFNKDNIIYDNISIVEINNLENLLYNGTYEEYIEYKKNKYKKEFESGYYDEKTYNILIKEQDMHLKYQSLNNFDKKNTYSWKTNLIRKYTKIQRSLLIGYNNNNEKYSNEEIEELKNNLILIEYSLDNNIDISNLNKSGTYSNSYYRDQFNDISKGLSMFFVTILIIVLSSSAVSEEFEKGTIKMLLITPFERYKILLSKLLAILIITILLTLVVSQVIYLFGEIMYPQSNTPYIYTSNGNIKVLNTYTYLLTKHILMLPEIIIYILTGLTLSVIFTKTSISNTFNIIMYLAIPLGIGIIASMFGAKQWLRYIPYNNFDLTSKVFNVSLNPSYSLMSEIFKEATKFESTIWFNLSILSIYGIILSVIMFNLFKRKNV